MAKILLGLSILTITLNLNAQVPTYTITVEISNVKNAKGNLLLALFNSAESYDQEERFKSKVQKAQTGKVKITWEAIPVGTYAFKIFHDENDNKSVDTNFFGIPSEGYAFSNNAKGTMGPPAFEAAKFDLKQNIIQTIKLNY